MRCFQFFEKSTIPLHGIGPSPSLQVFLRCCSLIYSIEKTSSPSRAYILLKKFSDISIFSAGIKSNNLPYFAIWSSILFRVLIFVLPPYLEYIAFSWFQLCWVPVLPFFSLSQTLKEITRFHLQNLLMKMSRSFKKEKGIIIKFFFVFVVVIASAYSTKSVNR